MKHPLNYVFQKGGGRGVGQNYVVLGVLTFYNFVLLPTTFVFPIVGWSAHTPKYLLLGQIRKLQISILLNHSRRVE